MTYIIEIFNNTVEKLVEEVEILKGENLNLKQNISYVANNMTQV